MKRAVRIATVWGGGAGKWGGGAVGWKRYRPLYQCTSLGPDLGVMLAAFPGLEVRNRSRSRLDVK
jgi:hypothetical protein